MNQHALNRDDGSYIYLPARLFKGGYFNPRLTQISEQISQQLVIKFILHKSYKILSGRKGPFWSFEINGRAEIHELKQQVEL